MTNLDILAEEVFVERTEPLPWSGCLIWTGPLTHNGYGTMCVGGKDLRAHRYAWERERGPIPEGMQVDHVCWNRLCCEVSHLRLATPAQNQANRSGARRDSGTGVRNVYATPAGTFQVRMTANGVRRQFGNYSTLAEAARVAEIRRAEMFGEFAGKQERQLLAQGA